jgi:hypothetical protein
LQKENKKMKRQFLSIFLALGMVVLFAGLTRSQGPRFTEWSAPEPVTALNLPGVNELAPSITHDGLRLYFMRAGDIYVSHRADRKADWEAPVALASPISLPIYVESAPFESTDGHWLFFISNRPGGVGGSDIWVSWRKFVRDDTAWQEPVNLSAVNSVGFEGGPMLFEDDETGTIQLYLAAAPYPGGTQALADIYVSNLGPDGFETPVPVVEVNSAAHDGKPTLRRDGLEFIFESYRLGLPAPFSTGGAIFTSTRSFTDQPWSAPTVVIGTTTAGNPGDRWITTPSLSHDSMTLYFAVNEPGTDFGDIYVSYRKKVKGNE